MNQKQEKLGIFGKFAKFFVLNDKLSLLLKITIFAWGAFSYLITPKQYNPEIVAPAFQIVTEFPGASSDEVFNLITEPMENKIFDINGMDDVMSQSIDGGASVVIAKFKVGENIEDSKIKLMEKMEGNMDLKPLGAKNPMIKSMDPDDVPILVLSLSSDKLSPIALRKFANELKEKLKTLENTSNIEVKGGKRRQLNIYLDEEKLTAKNVSILEIKKSLEENNIRIPAGDLDFNTKKIPVVFNGNINDAKDAEKIIVSGTSKNKVYLSDVAKIKTEEDQDKSIVRFRTKDMEYKNSVFLSIAKKKGSNSSSVSRNILNKIESLKGSFIPENIKINILRDEGKTSTEEINGLMINLIQAVLIVGIILFLFLGKRAALVVVISIPLTLAGVFGLGFIAGQTINRITLFALILSLGILVDNSTVVAENAFRHINKKGYKNKLHKKRLVIKAVDEVGAALFMSNLTTIMAFIPMAFVTGMMGPYMGPIPFFVPAALIFSMMLAFSTNPWMASKVIEYRSKEDTKESKLAMAFNSFFKSILSKLLDDKKARNKALIFLSIALVIALSLPALKILKFRMLPKADREQFYIYLDMPDSTLEKETSRVAKKIEDFLLEDKNVLSTQSFIGIAPVIDFNGLFKGASGRNKSSNATIKVNLLHKNKRDKKSEEIVLELRPKLKEALKTEPDANVKFIEDPPGPPVLSTVMLKIKGNNFEKLKEIAKDAESFIRNTKEVVDIDSTLNENVTEYILKVNKEKASKTFLNSKEIAYALRISLEGDNVGLFHDNENKEQEYIFLRLKKENRDSPNDLKNIYITNHIGEKVPLLELVDEIPRGSEDIIYSDNREKTVYVFGEMGNRSVVYASIDIFKKLFGYTLPSKKGEIKKISLFGVDYYDTESRENYSIEFGGEWELTIEVFRDLGAAMMVAIFLIYLVLVAQFKSFKIPLLIMGTIPLALIGVMPGFVLLYYLKGVYFNATSMIGVIALAGIVVNNSIILVEYINSLREKGIDLKKSLIEASTIRLRPILLTSATTVFGSLTIVGDPVWAGLGWSIVFGLSLSSVLTLIIFPVLYFIFMNKEDLKTN